jgi:hypothetical protein
VLCIRPVRLNQDIRIIMLYGKEISIYPYGPTPFKFDDTEKSLYMQKYSKPQSMLSTDRSFPGQYLRLKQRHVYPASEACSVDQVLVSSDHQVPINLVADRVPHPQKHSNYD